MGLLYIIFASLVGIINLSDTTTEVPVMDFHTFEQRLHKTNDTTYIVNFWATWCVPCRKELPDFEKINAAYKNKKVKVLLVSLDFPDNLEKGLMPFIKKNKVKSEVILLDDPNSNYWINKVDTNWDGNIPATLIYNKKYREFFAHALNYSKLDSILNSKIIMP